MNGVYDLGLKLVLDYSKTYPNNIHRDISHEVPAQIVPSYFQIGFAGIVSVVSKTIIFIR